MHKAEQKDKRYELICVIVNFGLGSKALSQARRSGVTGVQSARQRQSRIVG